LSLITFTILANTQEVRFEAVMAASRKVALNATDNQADNPGHSRFLPVSAGSSNQADCHRFKCFGLV
jgi:hypothetical protein